MIFPIVSVIMLTYNRERYIREAIASVLNQSFDHLELIILDDGSTDSTESIIQEMLTANLRYFKFTHSGRGSKLRNIGLEKSCGKFIAFIDSDDIWHQDKIQQQLGKLYSTDTPSFVFTDVIEFSDNDKILKHTLYKTLPPSDGKLFNQYVENKFSIYPSTMLFDRRCLELVTRFNESFPWTDNEFFHRLAFHYQGFLIQRPLVNIRKHDDNTSAKVGQGTVEEMIDMLKTFCREGMINKKTYLKMVSHYYYLSGILYLYSKDFSSARKSFLKCTRHSPFYLKAWVRGTLSLFYFRWV